MSDTTLSPVKQALIEIRRLRARLNEVETAGREPIAIVGIGLRFPGASSPEDFWRLLRDGVDAVEERLGERWDTGLYYSPDPDAPGKTHVLRAGLLRDIDTFDAAFFGIAPAEAESMDPQQRLLLEVTWEALEHAGIAPDRLRGSRSGVFVGISNSDYQRLQFGDRDRIDAYASSGSAPGIASGRLSYVLGLHGPAISVDTACSSSLVAAHLAIRSLRSGECDLALAAGVNLILTPEIHINFSKAHMLSADGRCKTFDARADGYVRGEGCGVLVLKRWRDAQKDGDRILALIRGSALNQDGRSSGLTAPNGPAQQAVIRAALDDAGVAPEAVGYVEAHGTGTSLGDPIEVAALGTGLCAGRSREEALRIGSVKTNIGHLEAAAGVAGVIKVVLALQHREIPAHLHFETGNPYIDWDHLPVEVVTRTRPWPTLRGRRIAGVSSFGFSGTNAHLILEEAPAADTPAPAGPNRPLHVLTLSADSPSALDELTSRLLTRLDEPLADVCCSANTGRAQRRYRLAAVAGDAESLRAALGGTGAVRVDTLQVPKLKIAFLFSGQGAQHAGMGAGIYRFSPVFRAAIDRCADLLHLPLPKILFEDGGERLDRTEFTQPALFAFEYALAELWRSWGVEPALVAGHSLGEYAAACWAGVFSLDAALDLVAARGRLMQDTPPGAMAALLTDRATVERALAAGGGRLWLAAENGPSRFTVTGEVEAVDDLLRDMERQGIDARRLRVSCASHSPLMDPILDAFERSAAAAEPRPPRLPLVLNLTGGVAPDEPLAPAYWRRHLREPVRFETCIRTLNAEGVNCFLEIGPHPVLASAAAEILGESTAHFLPSLRRGWGEWEQMLETLKTLYVNGAAIDWRAFDAPYPRRRVVLPPYPFERRKYWRQSEAIDPEAGWKAAAGTALAQSQQVPVELDVRAQPARWDMLARLAAAHIRHTLAGLGAFPSSGSTETAESLAARCGIAPAHLGLLRRWLAALAAGGDLVRSGDQFTASAPLLTPDLAALWAEADSSLADDPALLEYVRGSCEKLPAVITDKLSPLETLFPGGSFTLAENLYERSLPSRYVQGVAAAAVKGFAGCWPHDRLLRVLEIGAGTGSTTAALLDVLPRERTRYWFTDVSHVFLDRARQRFAAFPCVSFGLFDLEKDPAEAGFSEAFFDLIAAANVVHATRDVESSLRRLERLLAPGGILLLIESTDHMPWFDVTTGLVEGWNAFADSWRTENPLLAAEKWLAVLARAGFENAAQYPEPGSPAETIKQHVILAQRPAAGVRHGAVPDTAVTAAPVAPQERAGWAAELQALPEADRLPRMIELVRAEVAGVMHLDSSRTLDRRQRLMDAGVDSLMAVQLRNRLAAALGNDCSLPASLIFDYPTVEDLARYLLAQAGVAASSPQGQQTADIAGLSDQEVEAMLLARLEKK